MARTDPQFNIRMPEKLKEKIESAAAKSGRSMTAEVIHRLEHSFPSDETIDLFNPTKHVDKKVADLSQRVDELGTIPEVKHEMQLLGEVIKTQQRQIEAQNRLNARLEDKMEMLLNAFKVVKDPDE